MTTEQTPAGGSRNLPLVGETQYETIAVAAVIGAGMLTLYGIRRGMRGIGDFQLTGSTIGGLEWAAYAAVVGGTIRVLQANFPDNKVVQALAFVY